MQSIFVNHIRHLVVENELEMALLVLADFLEDKDTTLHQHTLGLQYNYNNADRENKEQLASDNDHRIALKRISHAILDLTKDLETLNFDDKEAMERATTFEKKENADLGKYLVRQTQSRRIYLWTGVALAFLGVGSFFMLRTDNETKAATEYDNAKTYRRLEDCAKTIYYTSRTIKLNPNHYAALNMRAECYMLKGQLDSAFWDAKKGLSLKPNNPGDLYSTMAQIESLLGHTEEFYRNIDSAMTYRVKIWLFTNQPGIKEHKDEERLIQLMEDYRQIIEKD